MRILWFTNTPCGALGKLSPGVVVGGWLYALEEQIKKCPEIELHVAFYYKRRMDSFVYNGVHYHPIYRKCWSSKINILAYSYADYLGIPVHENTDELLAMVHRVKPDVIHYHGSEQNFGLLQTSTGSIPSVLSIQGLLNPYAEKYYSGIPSVEANRCGLLSKLLLRTPAMSYKRFCKSARIEMKMLGYTKHIIGRTAWDRHCVMVLAPHAEYYVGNELLREDFYRAQWNKERFSTPFHIVSTISNGLYKGLEVILRTATNLRKVGFDFRWTVIGQSENDLYPSMVSRWLKSSFKDVGVNMVGRKGASEMIDILLDADVYCQVSHIENSPNSVCEAMLLGMPIVASCAGGTTSMLNHGSEGYIIQDGDSFSLAGTLMDVAAHFDRAKEWGSAARQRALWRHDPERVKNEYLSIYRKIGLNS